MSRYVSRPAEVWAERWTDPTSSPEGVRDVCRAGGLVLGTVDTVGGPAMVHFGDWVIRETVPGKHYPCAPDVFARRWVEA